MLSFCQKLSTDRRMYFQLLWMVFSMLDSVCGGTQVRGLIVITLRHFWACSCSKLSRRQGPFQREFFALRARVDFPLRYLAILYLRTPEEEFRWVSLYTRMCAPHFSIVCVMR